MNQVSSYFSVFAMIILLTTGGCHKDNPGYQYSINELRANDNPNTNKELFSFQKYNQRSDLILLACYSVNDRELGEFYIPDINKDLYIYYKDYLKCSLEDLVALQNDYHKANELWEIVTRLYPDSYLDHISYFQLFTDGDNRFISTVQHTENGDNNFILSLDIYDILDFDDQFRYKELTETLIHELGHIITLNSDETIRIHYKFANEKTYYIHELELDTLPNSYLNQFFQDFWTELYDEWSIFYYHHYGIAGDNKLPGELDKSFYLKYEDHFVSFYASTCPVEDIAESFLHFVVYDKPDGTAIDEQKILFFYNYPEMVDIRQQVRLNREFLKGF